PPEEAAKLLGAGPKDSAALRLSAPSLKHERAALLRYLTRVVEAAKLPPAQQEKAFGDLELQVKDWAGRGRHRIVGLLVPGYRTVTRAEQRSLAQLRCAILAVATELYRRERGAWPKAPAALVAARYLDAVPDDPYDGKPLRWRRTKEGVAV